MGIGTSGYVRVRVRNVRVARAVLAIASGHPGAKVHLGVAVFVKIDRFCATRWLAAACRAVAATATSVSGRSESAEIIYVHGDGQHGACFVNSSHANALRAA